MRIFSSLTISYPDLRETSCAAPKDILRRCTRPPFFSAFHLRHLELFAGGNLLELSNLLHDVSLAPFAKHSDDYPMLPLSVLPPSIIITELTRLNQAHIHDPRQPARQNDFTSSHPRFGNVYATRPISVELVRTDGDESKDEDDHKAAIASGHLRMAQVDLGWKRRQEKEPRKKVESPWQDEVDDDDDDSDLESEILALANGTEDEPQVQPAFYRSTIPVSNARAATNSPPERNELMLLRFFKQTEERGERLAQSKRKADVDDRAPLQMRKKGAKFSLTLQDLLAKPKTKVMSSSLSSSSLASSQAPRTISRPAGIAARFAAR